jgi:hypothetical protein
MLLPLITTGSACNPLLNPKEQPPAAFSTAAAAAIVMGLLLPWR